MRSKLTHPLFLVAFGVTLFALFMNLSPVLQTLNNVIGLIFPILLGLLFAFMLNVPMTGFERMLGRLFPKAKHKQPLVVVSLLLTLACIILVLVLAFTLLIPTLISSIQTVPPLIEENWPRWIAALNDYGIDTSKIVEWAASLDLSDYYADLDGILGSVVSGVRSTISGVASAAFGLVIAVYILLTKKRLAPQVKKLSYAYLKDSTADRLCYVARLTQTVYAKFLSGQCVEAILLGFLIFAAFSIFRLPYAALIGFLTGLFAFVPYVGAFASCAIGAFLILLVDPMKALISIMVYLAVQFIENQFIYPNVVGSSVGLAPLWTLIAALIGGKLFGLPGIIFFIPLAAVLYTLLREDANQRLQMKGIKKQEILGGEQE